MSESVSCCMSCMLFGYIALDTSYCFCHNWPMLIHRLSWGKPLSKDAMQPSPLIRKTSQCILQRWMTRSSTNSSNELQAIWLALLELQSIIQWWEQRISRFTRSWYPVISLYWERKVKRPNNQLCYTHRTSISTKTHFLLVLHYMHHWLLDIFLKARQEVRLRMDTATTNYEDSVWWRDYGRRSSWTILQDPRWSCLSRIMWIYDNDSAMAFMNFLISWCIEFVVRLVIYIGLMQSAHQHD